MARTATQIWCPSCSAIQPCRSVKASEYGGPQTGRWYQADHQDVQWFRRIRICEECGFDFHTAEIEERYLDELIELRNALHELKEDGAAFEADIKGATATLRKLSQSLKVLKALK